jgi:L-lactate utilization protein LutC
MELGAYATTWVPTTTAAVTRIADLASKTGVSSLIGQTEGTLFVDIIPTDVTTTNAIGINSASTTGRVIIFTGGNLIFGQVRVGAVTQFSVNTSATVGVRYKAAIAYKQNDFAFYVNGAQIAVSNTGTVPACSVISYDAGGAISPFLGRNNQAALFPTRLDNATLAALTTL